MKTADLYIRVSTDEQAEKGFSQRDQEERLTRYCKQNSITIRQVIFEDYSAKTFERPAWKKYLAGIKPQKNQLILFTKWDRFSRNTGDAYQMIKRLNKAGIDPQAIEQPLDMEIPESKLMLAVYLAAPEVDNDRRALNVRNGMRRAKKEGRWMATAPFGYKNKTDESGRKYIAPHEPQASVMRKAFEEIAKGEFGLELVRKKLTKNGLRITKSNFYRLIHNPVYCGYILVEEFKDEERHTVIGKHEAIISSELFFKVQEIISGRVRRKSRGTNMRLRPEFPLKGFLICPTCGGKLTGSNSRSKTGAIYAYYHCQRPCTVRFAADYVNESFEKELANYAVDEPVLELYRLVLHDVFASNTKDRTTIIRELTAELGVHNDKMLKARELLLLDALDAADYKDVKQACTMKIQAIEAQLAEVNEGHEDLRPLIDSAISCLRTLNTNYTKSDVYEKQRIVSSIFPEKLIFDGNAYRTPRLNTLFSLLDSVKGVFGAKKEGHEPDYKVMSRLVVSTGIEPISKV